MTHDKNGIPYEKLPSGVGVHDENTPGLLGPQPKRSQPMSLNSLIENDSPDDVETGAQSNTQIERP